MNTPLNPDALENAYAKYAELTVEEWRTRPHSAWRERVIEDVNIAVSAYLAVAQPVVNRLELDRLPIGSIVLDATGTTRTYVASEYGAYYADCYGEDGVLELPALVIYRPESS